MKRQILFQEKQKFTQWWIWVIILAPFLFIFFKVLMPVFRENPDNVDNISVSLIMPIESWIFILFALFVVLFVFLTTMKTTIDAEKIIIRHLYFVNKTWYWKDVEKTEVIKYGFVGYGIRLSLKHGTVYNVKGNKGLFLKLENGKRILIGTQKTDELQEVINNLKL